MTKPSEHAPRTSKHYTLDGEDGLLLEELPLPLPLPLPLLTASGLVRSAAVELEQAPRTHTRTSTKCQ
jgi:hypothetical protein